MITEAQAREILIGLMPTFPQLNKSIQETAITAYTRGYNDGYEKGCDYMSNISTEVTGYFIDKLTATAPAPSSSDLAK